MSMDHITSSKSNASLPLELVHHIVSNLLPRHLINAALVCHSWAILARRQLNQEVYIHSHRQYTRWLETLEAACIEHRQIVRKIVVHPQVHLDLSDLPILRLCPWVESFDIGTKNHKGCYRRSQKLNINDIIGRRSRYSRLLHHWRHLKRLHGYHSDPSTAWAPLLHSQLTSLVCSYDDICALSTSLGNSTAPYLLPYSTLIPLHHSCVLSDLVDLDLTFGLLDMSVTTLETIHTVCPVLENLKLHVQSIHGTTTSRMISSRTTGENGDDYPIIVSPVCRLKSLSLYEMVNFDPGCYSYLLQKYPLLDTLYLGFAFDEFYVSPLDRPIGDDDDDDDSENGGGDLCAYLRKNRSNLFDLISGYGHLARLEIHLQGANEYVASLWPSKEMEKWMQDNNNEIGDQVTATTKRTCRLKHLEMTYQRQSTEYTDDIFGLDGIINSWVGQHQLQTLLLDVYNNSRNKNNSNGTDSLTQIQQRNTRHSLQSTLDLFFYSDDLFASGSISLRNLTTLCMKCFPGFDISLNCLLDSLPGLRILDLAFGNLVNKKGVQAQSSCSFYGLQQLIMTSSNVTDTANFMDLIQHRCKRLSTLCFENVVIDDDDDDDGDGDGGGGGGGGGTGNTTTTTTMAVTTMESKLHVWDLSDRGLKHVWIKYLSFGGSKALDATKNGMVDCLKVHEATANRYTWYNTSMAQGTHGSSKPFHSSDYGLPSAERQGYFGNGGGASLELKCYFVEDLLFC